jgi:hypothetical protein
MLTTNCLNEHLGIIPLFIIIYGLICFRENGFVAMVCDIYAVLQKIAEKANLARYNIKT